MAPRNTGTVKVIRAPKVDEAVKTALTKLQKKYGANEFQASTATILEAMSVRNKPSPVTVMKAVERLAEEGWVSVEKGGRGPKSAPTFRFGRRRASAGTPRAAKSNGASSGADEISELDTAEVDLGTAANELSTLLAEISESENRIAQKLTFLRAKKARLAMIEASLEGAGAVEAQGETETPEGAEVKEEAAVAVA